MESTDAGNTWPTYFDPSGTPSNCSSQAIPAVAFSRQGTLIFATPCGIGVKAANSNQVSFPTLPTGFISISAVAASETKLWARAPNGTLLVSTDEGVKWKLATTKPLPTDANSFPSRGDTSSLAAFDNWAFMSTLGDNNGAKNNFSQLLIYDVANDNWVVQKRLNNALNGTGGGGRRQIKSFVFGTGGRVGTDLQLYFSTAQELYRATSQNRDGTLNWEKIAATGANTPPSNPQYQNPLHNDMWDFLVTENGANLWIATDGGVYQNTPAQKGWVTRVFGLHTHHIHTLFAPDNPDFHLAYATHDNDAWFRDNTSHWLNEGSLGDASWTAGDAGNPVAGVLVRRTGRCETDPCQCCVITGFGSNLPIGMPSSCATLNNDQSLDGPEFLAAIQTLKNEPPPRSPIDAVMLAKLPLQFVSGGNLINVPGHLGNPAADHTEDLVLLRNLVFVSTADINQSQGADWVIAANNLPAGTNKFWVSGGHANPVFYVLAAQSTGSPRLYKGSGGPPHTHLTQWQELNVEGSVLQARPFPDSGILDGATLGPVFVNPYDSTQVYVLTKTGVRFSTNGGFSFDGDKALTGLITGSGKYPLKSSFSGGNGSNVDYSNSYVSASMGTLSAMAFNRSTPGEIAAASPFTGVFFNRGDGKWVDLSDKLPKPNTPISAVAINDGVIYVATEGRGLLEIEKFK
jgi:hypothetical protein